VSTIFDGVIVPDRKQTGMAGESFSQSQSQISALPERKLTPAFDKGRQANQNALRYIHLHKKEPAVSSRRRIITAALVPVLALVLVLLNLAKLFKSEVPAANQKQSEPVHVQAAKEIRWHRPEPLSIVRDPMRLTGQTAEMAATAQLTLAEPQLTGIVFSELNPAAIIARKIVRRGDTVAGATVLEITKNSVIVEINGKKATLKITR